MGRQRQVWLIPTVDERVGVQVKLWNPLRTRAIPERFCGGDSLQRGAISKCMHLYLCLLPLIGMLTVVCFTVICFYLHCVQLWIK